MLELQHQTKCKIRGRHIGGIWDIRNCSNFKKTITSSVKHHLMSWAMMWAWPFSKEPFQKRSRRRFQGWKVVTGIQDGHSGSG